MVWVSHKIQVALGFRQLICPCILDLAWSKLKCIFFSNSTVPSAQDTWPPRDEFSQRRGERNERPRPRVDTDHSPFTYGTGLNPSLTSSNPSNTRKRPTASTSTSLARPKRHNVSPYHDNFESDSANEDEAQDIGHEEDVVPFGRIAARRAQSRALPILPKLAEVGEPRPVVRVRQGSEGYEVRPVLAQANHDLGSSEEDDPDDSDGWDRVEESEEGSDAEVEFDADGNKVQAKGLQRYKVYEPEPPSSDEDLLDDYWPQGSKLLKAHDT